MAQSDSTTIDDNRLGLPTFTQSSYCLTRTLSTEEYFDGTASPHLILGVDESDRECIPTALPSTRCPSPYEPVYTSTNTDLLDDRDTAYEIYCCPSHKSFEYVNPFERMASTRPITESIKFPYQCVATTSIDNANNLATPSSLDGYGFTDLRTVDIIAAPISLSYTVHDKTKTCVPDCDHPWPKGEPLPTTTSSALDPWLTQVSEHGSPDLGWVVPVLVILGVLGPIRMVFLICCVCSLWRLKTSLSRPRPALPVAV